MAPKAAKQPLRGSKKESGKPDASLMG